jgi:hypothetical protein
MKLNTLVTLVICASTQAFSNLPAAGNHHSNVMRNVRVANRLIEIKPPVLRFRQRMNRVVKAWTRNVAFLALATVVLRHHPRSAHASSSTLSSASSTAAVETIAFQSEIPDVKVANRIFPLTSAVIVSGGAGTLVGKLVIKRGESSETETSLEILEGLDSAEKNQVMSPVESRSHESSLSSETDAYARMETSRREKQRMAEIMLEKVKMAQEKALQIKLAKKVTEGTGAVSNTIDAKAPPKLDDAVGFSPEEKSQVINTVFECHGYFPDLRTDDELPAEVLQMRQQPKSKTELSDIKAKYASIEDESERVYTMLVDLGMMESYDHLEEYNDLDFDDDEE